MCDKQITDKGDKYNDYVHILSVAFAYAIYKFLIPPLDFNNNKIDSSFLKKSATNWKL